MENINTSNVMNKSSTNKKPKKYLTIFIPWTITIIIDALIIYLICYLIDTGKMYESSEIVVEISCVWFFIFRPMLFTRYANVKNQRLAKKYHLPVLLTFMIIIPEVVTFFLRHYFALYMDEMNNNPEMIFQAKISRKGVIKQNQKETATQTYRVQKYVSIDDKLNKLNDLKQRGLVDEKMFNQMQQEILVSEVK